MKKLRVTVDGKAYEVLVELQDEPAAPAPAPVVASAPIVSAPVVAPVVTSAPAAAPAAAGDVPSPLSGKVVEILVQVGQDVAEGAQLVTLEAMKMNTYVTAPRAGKVTAIKTTVGSAAEEGQGLITLS